MKLSEHFEHEEFLCPCCGAGKVNMGLIFKLEELRHELGDLPVSITSGYRCLIHNKDVGGAENSQHLLGTAADIKVKGKTPQEIAAAAEKVGFGGIGIYSSWVHVDVREGKARWQK